MQEVNEMWAGLGYYRRARFLLEVLSHYNIAYLSLSIVFLIFVSNNYLKPGGKGIFFASAFDVC